MNIKRNPVWDRPDKRKYGLPWNPEISKMAPFKMSMRKLFVSGLLLLQLPAALQAQFTFVTNNDALTITGYAGTDTNIIIPDTVNGYPVTSIGSDAFAFDTNVTSVTISTNVTSLGLESFRGCTNLATIVIPNSVTNLGPGVFAGCTALTSITIPGSVTYIDMAAFYYCTSLKEVYFQGNAPDIYTEPPGFFGLEVFSGDENATAFFLPGTTGWGSTFADLPTWSSYYTTNQGTITIFGYAGFGGVVTIPATIHGFPVTSIGTNAFAGNNSVTTVTIPQSVTNLEDGAFYLCTNLTTLYFQGNAPAMGSAVFYGITNAIAYYLPGATGWEATLGGVAAWVLYPFDYTANNGAITITGYTGGSGTLVIPGTIIGLPVTSIGTNAFSYQTGLGSVTMPDSVTNIGEGAFSSCYGLTNVTMGSSVTTIGRWAFADCRKLTGITIPDSVIYLGEGAFETCSNLSTITIPGSVTNIGIAVFASCTSLTGLYFEGNAPDFETFAFFAVTNATVYYLPGTTGWGTTFDGLPAALWKPQMQTSGAGPGIQTNPFGFHLNWASGQTVVVEASSNLIDWLPVQTNTLTGGTAYFSDPQWTNYPSRFYRLRSP